MTRVNLVLFALLFALAVGTVAAALAGEVVPVAILGFFVVLVGSWTVTPWVNQRPGLLNLRLEERGVVFPGSDFSRRSGWFTICSAGIGPVLFVVLVVSDEVTRMSPAVFSCCFALTVYLLAGPRQMRRWRRATVRLERNHVFVNVPFRNGYLLNWNAVPPLPEGSRPLARMLARNGSQDPKDRFPETELTSDPVLVAEIIEFYRANPKLRFELATARCVDRIRAGAFRVAGPCEGSGTDLGPS